MSHQALSVSFPKLSGSPFNGAHATVAYARITNTHCTVVGVKAYKPGNQMPFFTLDVAQHVNSSKRNHLSSSVTPNANENDADFIRDVILHAYQTRNSLNHVERIPTDILDAKPDIIVQQECDIEHIGKAMFYSIHEKYPFVTKAHKKYITEHPSYNALLGRVLWLKEANSPEFALIFTQNHPKTSQFDIRHHTDYDAIYDSLSTIFEKARRQKSTIGIPYYLGAGRTSGQGDWHIIRGIIDILAAQHNVTDLVTIYQRS